MVKRAPIAFIMLGIPGAGKSTLSAKLAAKYNAEICSADAYFCKSGEYKFNPKELGKAYGECFSKYYSQLYGGLNAIVDNTNLDWESIQRYQMNPDGVVRTTVIVEPDTSWRYNPEECFNKTLHGVPLDKIKQMYDKLIKVKKQLKDKGIFTVAGEELKAQL